LQKRDSHRSREDREVIGVNSAAPDSYPFGFRKQILAVFIVEIRASKNNSSVSPAPGTWQPKK
jgi:hypothetical protein